MVGDSFEDVEVGNAAGTATCLVAGGGNEKPGVVVVTPAGAVATFVVSGLPQLREMLQAGASAGLQLGWPAREAAGEAPADEGAPAPGLNFLDWCVGVGALSNGGASFPRMGRYAGGLATSDVQGKLTADWQAGGHAEWVDQAVCLPMRICSRLILADPGKLSHTKPYDMCSHISPYL